MQVDSEQFANSNRVIVNGEQCTKHDGNLSDSDTETEDRFECICGLEDYYYSSTTVVCCGTCGVLQHADCVFYEPEFLEDDDVYTCPYCLINKLVSLLYSCLHKSMLFLILNVR